MSWILPVLLALLLLHTVINARLLPRPAAASTVEVSVAALVPVRDEISRVRATVRSLLDQRGVPGLRIVVLDDGSTDGSADAVRAEAAGDARVRVLTGSAVPPGWLGKPYACHQLAAACPDAAVLAFVDADVVLAPTALASAVSMLDGHDLLSAYPRLNARTWAERLIQPLLPWSWLTFLPLRAMRRSGRPSLAAAGGQFLLLTQDGYRRAGGHAAVQGAVVEDVALARAVKRAGGRIGLADFSGLAACRMYDSWPGLRDGYAKSAWTLVGLPAAGLLGLLYLGPLVLLPFAPWAGLAGYLLGVAGRVVTGRATGARVWPDALAHPASIGLLGYLVLLSRHRHRRGALTWKGRTLP